jgi:hypothetical protein
LPQKFVIGSGQIRDLDNALWPNLMNPRQQGGRPEPGGARRRDFERHLVRLLRLKPFPEIFELIRPHS